MLILRSVSTVVWFIDVDGMRRENDLGPKRKSLVNFTPYDVLLTHKEVLNYFLASNISEALLDCNIRLSSALQRTL